MENPPEHDRLAEVFCNHCGKVDKALVIKGAFNFGVKLPPEGWSMGTYMEGLPFFCSSRCARLYRNKHLTLLKGGLDE